MWLQQSYNFLKIRLISLYKINNFLYGIKVIYVARSGKTYVKTKRISATHGKLLFIAV